MLYPSAFSAYSSTSQMRGSSSTTRMRAPRLPLGCSGFITGSQEVIEILFAAEPAADAEDVRGLRVRVERDEIAPAAPEVALVVEQVVHLIRVAFKPAELFDWHVNVGVVSLIRIEVDDDEDDVVARLSHF